MRTGDRFLTSAAAAAIVLALVAPLPRHASIGTMLAGAALVALADLLRVRLTGERPSSLAVAPGLGIALLTKDPALAVAAFAVGTGVVGVLRRLLHRDAPPAVGGHLLAVGAAASVYGLLSRVDPVVLASHDGASGIASLAFVAAVASLITVDTAIRAWRESERARTVARALIPFHLAAASAAALFALAEPSLGAFAYPLFLGPLLATHHAFTQLTSVRRTFGQMIRALSSVPEVAGYSHPGHAARTAAIARSIGRELRLPDREVGELEMAARLHDLGKMRATTPDQVATLSASELAAAGAGVVRRTGTLPRVAQIIEHAHEPFRGDRRIPIGARIVRAASTFDDLTATGVGALSDVDAIASMRRGGELRFEPAVVDALARVVGV